MNAPARRSRTPLRRALGVVVAVGLGTLVQGCGLAQDSPTAATTPVPSASSTPAAPATTSLAPSAPRSAAPSAGGALEAVPQLRVAGRGPKTGYDRDLFGQPWFDADRNGCDTRNDVLRRDLVDRTMKNDCKVLAGTLSPDPYTGTTIRFEYGGASEVDIDHAVALSDAWQKGAAQWRPGTRLAFANDPLNLLAVDASTNRAKGDGDTATWLPPDRSSRCSYVARQVAVKKKYDVRVTAAERDAMVRVLSACPDRALPAPGSAPTVAALPRSQRTTTAAVPAPRSAPAPRAAAPTVVHPGAYCTPQGAPGVTSAGTAMACTTKPGDDRARWRSR